MTLSQLVEALEDARAKYGDCQVVIHTDKLKERYQIVVLARNGDHEVAKIDWIVLP